ncbi:MAG: cysteine desulfurase [Planctomycetaceae bacterium]|nr:cysteine desulfurase [Planctomycetaceae bacterium]
MKTIYLDHNATTSAYPEVVEAVSRCMAEGLGNPASQHRAGQRARQALGDAREEVAAILGVDLAPPRRDRLVFTSGGTEANNLAVLGIARAAGGTPGRVVISAGEHQSVIEPAEHLLEQGWRMDTLGLRPDGVVRVEQLRPLLGPGTRLVSVLLGNHETGVLQPVEELAAMCNGAGVPLHTDAVQVAGKLAIDFGRLGAAAMSVAAHKFGGPLGIGALIVRRDVALTPLMFGGHQQAGLRPGTEPVALAVGMATALRLCQERQAESARRMTALRERFEKGLMTALPDVVIHGARAPRLPQTSNIAFPGIDGEVLRMALDLAGVACSVGAACASGSTELSPTLRAMELPKELVASSLRFSLGVTTTEAEVDEAVGRIARVCGELRESR